MKLEQIDRLKKIVRTQYPGARLSKTRTGKFTIVQEQNDLSVKDLFSEFLFPPVESELAAWERAASAVKIEKNFNRSHPLKSEISDIELKMQRISYRNKRSVSNRKSRKN